MLRFIRGHWVRRPTLSCWDWGRNLTCQHLFDHVVKSTSLLCAILPYADCISLHCKVSFYKRSLLKVILAWEVFLYLLGAVLWHSDTEKCTGTVIIAASLFFSFAIAVSSFVLSLYHLELVMLSISLCRLLGCQITSIVYYTSISFFSPNDLSLRKGVNPSMHFTRYDLSAAWTLVMGSELPVSFRSWCTGLCIPIIFIMVQTELCPSGVPAQWPCPLQEGFAAMISRLFSCTSEHLCWTAGNLLTNNLQGKNYSHSGLSDDPGQRATQWFSSACQFLQILSTFGLKVQVQKLVNCVKVAVARF